MLSFYIVNTNKLLEKLASIQPESNAFYEPDIGSCVIQSRLCGLSIENGDTSVFVGYCLIDNQVYTRCLYQIKTQTSGKVKNIDSVMALITQFEHEYVYADKISVAPESGCIYVDIYKLKKD